MKKIKYTLLAMATAGILLTSCVKDNPDSPGFEYFPDMYRSQSYETNGVRTGDSIYVNGVWLKDTTVMANMVAPDGTIPRGFTAYPYENSPIGDSLSSVFWKSPYPQDAALEKKGERLYGLYCVYCHGTAGKADGPLVASEKYGAVPPNYLTLAEQGKLSDGHIYHVITYGKGNMGSHASQLTPDERWAIIAYVKRLGRGNMSMEEYQKKMSAAPAADSAKADSAGAAAKPAAQPK